MYIFLIHFLIFFGGNQDSSKVLYKEKSNDYSIEISNTAKVIRKDLENGYVDNFIIYDAKGKVPLYYLAVNKMIGLGKETSNDEMMSEDFKTGLLSRCNCEIYGRELKKYEKVQGVEFTTSLTTPKVKAVGFYFTTIKGSNLYNISFFVEADKKDKYFPAFKDLVNSLEIIK